MLASVGNPEFYAMDGSWIPDPNSFWYTLAGVENFGPPNLEKAKEFLAESNYDGTPLRWLVASEQYQKHYLTAVTAAQQLEEIGIHVEIIENPMANYIQLRANPDEMDVFSSFLPTYVDPTSIAYLNPSYPGFWTYPPKMELMQKLATTIDPAERKKIFEEVHAMIYDQFPFIKYGTESNMYGIRTGTDNVAPLAGRRLLVLQRRAAASPDDGDRHLRRRRRGAELAAPPAPTDAAAVRAQPDGDDLARRAGAAGGAGDPGAADRAGQSAEGQSARPLHPAGGRRMSSAPTTSAATCSPSCCTAPAPRCWSGWWSPAPRWRWRSCWACCRASTAASTWC